jgi:ABC-type nitrate/sulfonate/bicarbonate transport system permease component
MSIDASQPRAVAPAVGGRTLRRRPGPRELDPQRTARQQRRLELAAGVLVPVVLLAAWEAGTRTGAVNRQFFPAPTDVLLLTGSMLLSGELIGNLLISLQRIALGLGLGVATGVILGVLMGSIRLVRAALDPLLSALYTVPKLALLPLLLLIFGIGETPKILVIAITVFFFMWISTMEAILNVSDGHLETARSFGARRWQLLQHVLLPAALPEIFVGLQISAGVTVLVMVAVEFVQGSNGIGHLIWFSWSLFDARKMYVGIAVVAVLGLVLTRLVRSAARHLLPWATTEGAAGHTHSVLIPAEVPRR